MVELARRTKPQAPPPHVVFEALTQPHRPQGREWLRLETAEIEPMILEAHAPDRVTWSTLWPEHPSARVAFEIVADGEGSKVTWMLSVDDDAVPDDTTVSALRYRLNELINRDLRLIAFDC